MEYSSAALAYLGDAVIELYVRERLVRSGISDAGRLNEEAKKYVQADAQSAAAGRILPYLTEEEDGAFRRGRNMHSPGVPKHAKTADYRRATGLEALFAHLYLSGDKERLDEVFSLAFDTGEEK